MLKINIMLLSALSVVSLVSFYSGATALPEQSSNFEDKLNVIVFFIFFLL